MIHFQPNKTSLNNAVKHTALDSEKQQWQDNIKNDKMNNPQTGLSFKKSLGEIGEVKKPTGVYAAQSVSFRDEKNNLNDDDAIILRGNISKSDASRFDMKADMKKFVQPPIISGNLLSKDELWETSKHIMDVLDKSDASPALKKRASQLLQEEQKIKSIMSGYQNALIFS
jgi:hypothetical protein